MAEDTPRKVAHMETMGLSVGCCSVEVPRRRNVTKRRSKLFVVVLNVGEEELRGYAYK